MSSDSRIFEKILKMHLEIAYLVVVGLLLVVGAFYLSPFELKVNEDDEDE